VDSPNNRAPWIPDIKTDYGKQYLSDENELTLNAELFEFESAYGA
jgi:hypothetical protein